MLVLVFFLGRLRVPTRRFDLVVPADWGWGRLIKSESDMFQEHQKMLIHFCMNQREDVAWKVFGNRTRSQIGWPCKKIDGIWSLSVPYVKQFTDGGIISSHQNYVDSESGEKRKEAMRNHHFVILQLFHPKYQKV